MNKLTNLLSLATLGSLALVAAGEPSEEVREWTSQDGQYSVMASLSGFDRTKQRVSLSKADATVVEVPLSRLSAADRSYVAEYFREPERRSTGVPSEKTLYGIRWQPAMQDALAEASGAATPDDDLPVLWFRVLGELEEDL